MSNELKKIEVCFSPATYHRFHNTEANVVIVDILRATSAMCTAFMNGVKSIIPVATLEEAKAFKLKSFLVAAERDGIKPDFADFGNSPFNFTAERVGGKDVVYSTTNGTKAVEMAKACNKVLIGAYLNINALAQLLISDNRDVVIFCAGWKDRFSLEDSLFAGALSELLIESNLFYCDCDSAIASLDLWSLAKPDLNKYILKVAQRSRLQKSGLDDSIEYCHTLNLTNIIPIYKDGFLSPSIQCEKNNKKAEKKNVFTDY